MKYTVVNAPIADYQLAEIWMKMPDRQAVTDAFNQIEALLKHDAHLQGREHPAGWRSLAIPPLGITFRVSEDDRLATIMSVFYRP